MTLPIKTVFAPPSISGTTNMPIAGIKVRIVPAIIPGTLRGNVTLRNAIQGGAPRSAAASRSEFSIFSRDVYNGNTINGKNSYTIPIITAVGVYNRLIGSRV